MMMTMILTLEQKVNQDLFLLSWMKIITKRFCRIYYQCQSQTNFSFAAAARQTRDADQNRRREELQRRIEETRQKLQNVRHFFFNSVIRPIFFLFPPHLHLCYLCPIFIFLLSSVFFLRLLLLLWCHTDWQLHWQSVLLCYWPVTLTIVTRQTDGS